MEASLRARAKDPQAFAATLRAQGAGDHALWLALYERDRAAAIVVGTFKPEPTGDAE